MTRFQAFIGVKKGDPNIGWMRSSGAMTVLQTVTVSNAAVPSKSLVTPGPVVARAVLSSAMVGAGTSQTVTQSGLTLKVAGSIPRWMSRAKASISPSSGVVQAKDGVTYCTPRRTLMWGSGDVKQMSSRGRSVRGNVVIISSHNLGVVTSFSLRRVNSAWKALRSVSSVLDAPSTAKVSWADCCVCCRKYSGDGYMGVLIPADMCAPGSTPPCNRPQNIYESRRSNHPKTP